jgi:hypothetical protein
MLEAEIPATMEAADAALTSPSESPEVTPEPVVAEPTAQAEGQPRDDQGRFTSPAPKAEEPEPATAEAVPAPETPSEPPTEPEAEAPAETYEPLKYRADNQDFDIPGSAVGTEGAFIPAAALPELQQLLSAGRAAFGSVRQRLSEAANQVQQANAAREAAEAQSTHLLSHFEQLIQSGQAGAWLEGVAQNWPILKAEASKKAMELQYKAERDELTRLRQQEEQSRLKPLMDSTLRSTVQSYSTRAGLDADGQAEVLRVLQEPRFQNFVFVRAPFDDPQSGIKQGDLVIDYSVVEGEVQRVRNWTSRYQPKAPAKIADALQRNAAKEPPKKVQPPPTVAAKGTKAPKQGSGVPSFKTQKEADEWFTNGGYNEL